MFKSLLSLAETAVTVVTAPVAVALAVADAATKPIREEVEQIVADIKEDLK